MSSTIAMTTINHCFICNEDISVTTSPHRIHNKIDLCSEKCKDAFRERLVDQKSVERSPSFQFNVTTEFVRANNSPETSGKIMDVKIKYVEGRYVPSRRNLFKNFNDTKTK